MGPMSIYQNNKEIQKLIIFIIIRLNLQENLKNYHVE